MQQIVASSFITSAEHSGFKSLFEDPEFQKLNLVLPFISTADVSMLGLLFQYGGAVEIGTTINLCSYNNKT